MTLRLLIVDDNVHFLATVRGLLEREGLSVVGVAATSAEALRGADELRPDVMLVDVDLAEENGIDLARQLTDPAVGPVPSVILISAYPEEDLADLVSTSGAAGFLSKSRLSAQAIRELLGKTNDGRRTL